jgi:hypothetical protein
MDWGKSEVSALCEFFTRLRFQASLNGREDVELLIMEVPRSPRERPSEKPPSLSHGVRPLDLSKQAIQFIMLKAHPVELAAVLRGVRVSDVEQVSLLGFMSTQKPFHHPGQEMNLEYRINIRTHPFDLLKEVAEHGVLHRQCFCNFHIFY